MKRGVFLVLLLGGCAVTNVRTVGTIPHRNQYVMYEVSTSWSSKACWVDGFDGSGKLISHDLCVGQPAASVLAGVVQMTGQAAAVGATAGVLK